MNNLNLTLLFLLIGYSYTPAFYIPIYEDEAQSLFSPQSIGEEISVAFNGLDGEPCADAWRSYQAPVYGTVLGKVCTVANKFYCDLAYYKPEDVVGTGKCHILVE